MTTNDSTSDDYTTDGPAVFDELPTPASAAEGVSTSEGEGASAGATASASTPASVLPGASTPAGLDREPELVGASAGVSGATQPTVPLSAAPSMAPQGGFGSTTYSSGWGPDGAQGAPTAPGAGGYGAPGAGAPGYSMPAAAAQATVYPPQRRTSLLAVLTLVFGILGFGVVPVVTGHIALSQLKRTGEDGRGLALAGLILGYVTLAGWVLALLAWLGVAGAALLAAFFSAIAH
ncbi:hypothetical protein GCM10010988_19300 [Cnuibacter physcomitrellae]|uniref:Uncharacterized protein n=1 Tax=Cnuibacter physcomitrellae TaxID=1619308 RepID=A0A1X9LN54_9MICO|nr:DUF4190 domain-containing protein [Cnuibacter physcomitrellae]ARJ06645.1 hypothetical protein B5808_16505 [Cnuibacter physcomitrellae]GGI38497.1 hypothetical protein GCM10010988_19300 [Cnuibacter physcomitrellae]